MDPLEAVSEIHPELAPERFVGAAGLLHGPLSTRAEIDHANGLFAIATALGRLAAAQEALAHEQHLIACALDDHLSAAAQAAETLTKEAGMRLVIATRTASALERIAAAQERGAQATEGLARREG